MWHTADIRCEVSAGNFFRSALLIFLLCCFSASAVSLQTCFVSDVFTQLVELNENENQESEEEHSSENEGDQDHYLSWLSESAYAFLISNQRSTPPHHLAKNTREKASTPPPEQA